MKPWLSAPGECDCCAMANDGRRCAVCVWYVDRWSWLHEDYARSCSDLLADHVAYHDSRWMPIVGVDHPSSVSPQDRQHAERWPEIEWLALLSDRSFYAMHAAHLVKRFDAVPARVWMDLGILISGGP